jgi:hypothetical protein
LPAGLFCRRHNSTVGSKPTPSASQGQKAKYFQGLAIFAHQMRLTNQESGLILGSQIPLAISFEHAHRITLTTIFNVNQDRKPLAL